MDYDGRNRKTNLETKLKIQALAVFGGMLYWQNTKSNVIKIMNATTADTDRNISLSGLSDLAVINILPHPICKFVYLFTFIVDGPTVDCNGFPMVCVQDLSFVTFVLIFE